jgi:2-iminobutanoate/2-iminopropanoate deaminase
MPKSVPPITNGPKPIGAYNVAVEAGGLVFISGQIAIDPATNEKVGGDVGVQARRVLDNIGLVLGDLGLDFDALVKTTIFLADIADFPTVNQIYAEYVGDVPPARSTIEAGALPGGFLVEIEAIATR